VLAVYQVTPWAGTAGFYVRTKTNTTQRYALRTSKGDVANYVQVAANVADNTLALTLENDAPVTPPGADPNGGSGVNPKPKPQPQPQPSGVASWSKSKQVGVFCGIAAAAVVVATVIAVSVVVTRKKSRARGVSRTKPRRVLP
jgi:hypothetical protein